jgi:hypothetical protein
MNYSQELTGSWVLVHPELDHDPASRRGQIGMVTLADLERDDIYVSFGAGGPCLYATNALLVLKNPNDIYRDLLVLGKEMDTTDFKKLFQISLLAEYGDAYKIKTALEMAMASPALRAAGMISLEQKLGLQLPPGRQSDLSWGAQRGR